MTNQNREATRTVNEYSVLELLGAGSYGSVYKVKKITSESVFAMKEVEYILEISNLLDVFTGCVYWMCLLDVFTGCVYWMCLLDVFTGCVY